MTLISSCGCFVTLARVKEVKDEVIKYRGVDGESTNYMSGGVNERGGR